MLPFRASNVAVVVPHQIVNVQGQTNVISGGDPNAQGGSQNIRPTQSAHVGISQGISNVPSNVPQSGNDQLSNIQSDPQAVSSYPTVSDVVQNVGSSNQPNAFWHFTMDQVLHLVSHAQSGALNNMSAQDIQNVLVREIPHSEVQNQVQGQTSDISQVAVDQSVNVVAHQQQPPTGATANPAVTDPVQNVQLEQQSQNLSMITDEDVQHLFDLYQTGSLNTLTPHQLQQLDYQVNYGNFGHLPAERLQQLEIVVQTLNLSTNAGAQDVQTQQQQQIVGSQNSANQMSIQQSQQQTVASISSGTQQQQVPPPNDPNVWKVTFSKGYGTAREFLVNDLNGQHVSSFCEQVDINSGQSHQSGSSMGGPTTVQRFPPHTIRSVDPAQLQRFNQSQHSDTSSSLASGTASIRSGGSAGVSSTLTSSGVTR